MTAQPSFGAVACPHVVRPGDPGLVGGWNMVPVEGVLPDVTGNGNDGVLGISTLEDTILGPMRRYSPNTNADGTTMGGANAFPLGDMTVAFWARVDLGATGTGYGFNYFKDSNDGFGPRYDATGAGQWLVLDDIDNAGASLYATTFPRSKLGRVVVVMDTLEVLFYLDGELVGSGTSASDDWASFTGTLYHGARQTTSNAFEGIASPMEVYNYAWDADRVRADYLKAAGAIPFRTMYGARALGVSETAGYLGQGSTPFEIVSGTWALSSEMIDGVPSKSGENVANGVVALPTSSFFATPTEAAFGTCEFWLYKDGASTTNFMPVAAQPVAWNDASQNGYLVQINSSEVLGLYRITAGGAAATLINTAGGYVSPNTWYRLWLTRRYDGVFVLYILGGAYTTWTTVGTSVADLTYTTSNYNIFDLDAGDRFGYCDARGGHNLTHRLICADPDELPAAA